METLVYASLNKKSEVRSQSSSGGVFYELASYVLGQNGVVFGAKFDDSWMVVHDYCESIDNLKPFLGSKYVQSRIGDTYKKVKEFLKDNRLVLFCGTPCQVYGLKCYLKQDYDNLILVDFVCHGVPSPEVWKTYLDEHFDRSKITDIHFRDKITGWRHYSVVVKQSDETYSCIHEYNEYIKGFLADIYLRPSCYECHFKGIKRDSDITLGDLWGIHHFELPEVFYDDQGVSLVMVHSTKGKDIFDHISHSFSNIDVDIERAIQGNPSIEKSPSMNKRRTLFYKQGIKEGVHHLEKILKPSFIKKIRRKVKRILKKGL